MKKGALSGLRVIDFGQYIAGPMASMILSDYGADVIHVDPPGGPVWNGFEANAVLMRGKQNITLDLKNQEENAIAKRLIETADVVIENFRPGVMNKLGLGTDIFKQSNPALIYCSMPGFSASDNRFNIRGWEGIISAEAGLYTDVLTGQTRFNTLYLASVFAAVMACHSIVAALIVRHKYGCGQSIEVPLYDACFEIEGVRGVSPPAGGPMPPTNGKVVSDYALMKLLTKYPCKDGKYIQVTPPPRGTANMVKAFIPEDWGYASELTQEQEQQLKEIIASKTAMEWELCGQEEHQAGVVTAQTTQEWLQDNSALDSKCVIHVKDTILGDTLQPGVPSIMTVSGDSAGYSPRNYPNADSQEIFKKLERLTPPNYQFTGNIAAPLKGIKVLDFCQVLAGPICGRILAEYGAEVIKINNPRTYENPIAMAGHETVNNGKLTTFIDLKSPEGKKILDILIKECDVFHCNFSQHVYERYGVTELELRAKNPSIILSQVNVHSIGGWRQWQRGHEDLGEAVTGLSVRYGDGKKPENLPVLVCDNLTGHCSALGVLLAIYYRMLTGKGQRVQACLSRSATIAQIPYLLGYQGKIWNEPAGNTAYGWSMFNRIYKTLDGYIFIATGTPKLCKKIRQLENIDFTSTDAEQELEKHFLTLTSNQWIKVLSSSGFEARALRNFSTDAMEEDYAKSRGLSRTDFHKNLGVIRVTSCAPRLSLTPPIPGFPVCEPGGDTESFFNDFMHDTKN